MVQRVFLGDVFTFVVHEVDVGVELLVTGSFQTALVFQLPLVLLSLDYQQVRVCQIKKKVMGHLLLRKL